MAVGKWMLSCNDMVMIREVFDKYPLVLDDQKRWCVVATECLDGDDVIISCGVVFSELLVRAAMKSIRDFRNKYNTDRVCKLRVRKDLPLYHE